MNLHIINTGKFKLDGGAMFGVVPQVIWKNLVTPDENNLCTWSMRCLLIEEGDRLILIDTGLGDKQSEKFFSYYFLSETIALEKTLNEKGFTTDDVTDVFLTHLHFDHCGGAVERVAENSYRAVFKNATYWSNQSHWDWAITPNPREKASFLKENILPLQESGQLKMINPEKRTDDLPFEILFMDGHTEKQMLPKFNYKGRDCIFAADLIPSYAHVPLPYVMGFDVRPLVTMTEKKEFLKMAAENNSVLFFEHDAQNECASVKFSEKGVVIESLFPLSAL